MIYTSKAIKPGAFLSLSILLITLLMHSSVYAEAGLRLLTGYPVGGAVNGLSQDGSVAAGTVVVGTDENDAAFVWNEIDGVFEIGYLPGQILNEADGISDDGLKIYGRGDRQPYFTWTSADGIVPITLPDGFSANFHAISGDGTTLAGKYISPDDLLTGPVPDEAFRLVGNTVTRLGFLSSYGTTEDRSIAYAISGDGSVVVGQSSNDVTTYPEAFRWTESGDMVGLGLEVSGVTQRETIARVVSRDGTVIAGTSRVYISDTEYPYTLYSIFIWTEATGMVQIYSSSSALEVNGMSADGSVIVGRIRQTSGGREDFDSWQAPFRWSAANGMQTVIEWLQEAGVVTGTVDDGHAWSVSADGNTVGGNIRDHNNTDAGEWPFIATVVSDDVFVDGFE